VLLVVRLVTAVSLVPAVSLVLVASLALVVHLVASLVLMMVVLRSRRSIKFLSSRFVSRTCHESCINLRRPLK
jgi:hypothetical protein